MTAQLSGTSNTEIIKIRGIVTSGVGEGKLLTEIPWVKQQFINKLGINAHPGTFNITVLAEDAEKLNAVRKAKGIEIAPEDVDFCTGKGFLALVNDKIRGAVVIPLVPNYPLAQLEIISGDNIKQALTLKDGDRVEVDVYL